MTFPSILLGLVIATFYASLYHAIRGGGGSRWLFFILLGVTGFFAGQWLSTSRGWQLLSVGTLELGIATIGAYVFLGLGDLLMRPRRGRDRTV